MDRRRLLTVAAGAGLSTLAGCTGSLWESGKQSTGRCPAIETLPSMQFQYDARNSGVSPGDAPATARPCWRETIQPIDGGASVADDTVVVCGDELAAFDASTGEKMWGDTVDRIAEHAPAVTDETVYIGTAGGMDANRRGLVAIDLPDGDERWRAIPEVHVRGAPTLTEDLIVVSGYDHVGADSGEVIAIDAATREERWRFETGPHTPPVAVADSVVYVGGGGSIPRYTPKQRPAAALDADTGDVLWRWGEQSLTGTYEPVTAAPTVVDETVYIGTSNGNVYALDTADGSERWHVSVGSTIRASAAATEETIFVPARESLTAVDAADGTELWRREMVGTQPPTVAGDAVVVGTADGVRCLDAADGTDRWQFEPDGRVLIDVQYSGMACAPVVVDSVVYVPSAAGYVYALTDE